MPPRVQCLIFIAYEEMIPDILNSSPFQRTQAYALVPNTHHYNSIHQMLGRYNVRILSRPPFDPFFARAIKSSLIEFFYIELYRDGGQWGIGTPVINQAFIRNIFRGTIFSSLSCRFGFFEPKSVLNREKQSIIRHLVDVRTRGEDDGTFLHFAAEVGHIPLVRLLLDSGAQLNSRTLVGDLTPLHIAAYQQSHFIASLLLEAGASVNATCISGSKYDDATPLHCALLSIQTSPRGAKMVELLLNNGASVNADSRMGTVLQMAALSNSLEALRYVLNHQPDLQTAANRETLRVVLGQHNSMKPLKETILLRLHNYGCRLNPNDSKNLKLLAGASGRPEFMEHLLKYGASVHYAARAYRSLKGNRNILEYLLDQAIQNKRCESVGFLLQLDDSCAGQIYALKKVINKDYSPDLSLVIPKDVLDSAYLSLRVFLDLDFPVLFELPYNEHVFNPGYDFKDLTFKHVRSLKALDLKCNETLSQSDLPPWMLKALSSPLLHDHEAEVAKMREETIAGTAVSFYDILNLNVSQIVRFLRNTSVPETLNTESMQERFPIYFPIIKWRFRKAFYRKSLLEKGMKMFNFLYKESPLSELPFEIKEEIIDFLNNLDLLVFVNVCQLPVENLE